MTPKWARYPTVVLIFQACGLLWSHDRPAKGPTDPAVSLEAADIPPVVRLGLSRDTPTRIVAWFAVDELPDRIAQFETVFWDPRDTESLRRRLREQALVKDKTVLEIGTGTGLVALCCSAAQARKVVATDVNPSAIANLAYNAELMGFKNIEPRIVGGEDSSAYAVIENSERFDLIISNPPWEDQKPTNIAEYALYDENFALLRSILRDLRTHLNPTGQCLLAYGCVDAIRKVQELGKEYNLRVRLLDDRDIDTLPKVFLPGMLLEVTPADAHAA